MEGHYSILMLGEATSSETGRKAVSVGEESLTGSQDTQIHLSLPPFISIPSLPYQCPNVHPRSLIRMRNQLITTWS